MSSPLSDNSTVLSSSTMSSSLSPRASTSVSSISSSSFSSSSSCPSSRSQSHSPSSGETAPLDSEDEEEEEKYSRSRRRELPSCLRRRPRRRTDNPYSNTNRVCPVHQRSFRVSSPTSPRPSSSSRCARTKNSSLCCCANRSGGLCSATVPRSELLLRRSKRLHQKQFVECSHHISSSSSSSSSSSQRRGRKEKGVAGAVVREEERLSDQRDLSSSLTNQKRKTKEEEKRERLEGEDSHAVSAIPWRRQKQHHTRETSSCNNTDKEEIEKEKRRKEERQGVSSSLSEGSFEGRRTRRTNEEQRIRRRANGLKQEEKKDVQREEHSPRVERREEGRSRRTRGNWRENGTRRRRKGEEGEEEEEEESNEEDEEKMERKRKKNKDVEERCCRRSSRSVGDHTKRNRECVKEEEEEAETREERSLQKGMNDDGEKRSTGERRRKGEISPRREEEEEGRDLSHQGTCVTALSHAKELQGVSSSSSSYSSFSSSLSSSSSSQASSSSTGTSSSALKGDSQGVLHPLKGERRRTRSREEMKNRKDERAPAMSKTMIEKRRSPVLASRREEEEEEESLGETRCQVYTSLKVHSLSYSPAREETFSLQPVEALEEKKKDDRSRGRTARLSSPFSQRKRRKKEEKVTMKREHDDTRRDDQKERRKEEEEEVVSSSSSCKNDRDKGVSASRATTSLSGMRRPVTQRENEKIFHPRKKKKLHPPGAIIRGEKKRRKKREKSSASFISSSYSSSAVLSDGEESDEGNVKPSLQEPRDRSSFLTSSSLSSRNLPALHSGRLLASSLSSMTDSRDAKEEQHPAEEEEEKRLLRRRESSFENLHGEEKRRRVMRRDCSPEADTSSYLTMRYRDERERNKEEEREREEEKDAFTGTSYRRVQKNEDRSERNRKKRRRRTVPEENRKKGEASSYHHQEVEEDFSCSSSSSFASPSDRLFAACCTRGARRFFPRNRILSSSLWRRRHQRLLNLSLLNYYSSFSPTLSVSLSSLIREGSSSSSRHFDITSLQILPGRSCVESIVGSLSVCAPSSTMVVAGSRGGNISLVSFEKREEEIFWNEEEEGSTNELLQLTEDHRDPLWGDASSQGNERRRGERREEGLEQQEEDSCSSSSYRDLPLYTDSRFVRCDCLPCGHRQGGMAMTLESRRRNRESLQGASHPPKVLYNSIFSTDRRRRFHLSSSSLSSFSPRMRPTLKTTFAAHEGEVSVLCSSGENGNLFPMTRVGRTKERGNLASLLYCSSDERGRSERFSRPDHREKSSLFSISSSLRSSSSDSPPSFPLHEREGVTGEEDEEDSSSFSSFSSRSSSPEIEERGTDGVMSRRRLLMTLETQKMLETRQQRRSDCCLIASGGKDGWCKVSDLQAQRGEPLYSTGGLPALTALCAGGGAASCLSSSSFSLSPLLFMGDVQGCVRLWDVRSPGRVSTLTRRCRDDDEASSERMGGSGSSRAFVKNHRGTVRGRGGGLAGKRISELSVHPESDRVLASASADGSVTIWDLRKGVDDVEPLLTIGPLRGAQTACFSPSGRKLLCASRKDHVFVVIDNIWRPPSPWLDFSSLGGGVKEMEESSHLLDRRFDIDMLPFISRAKPPLDYEKDQREVDRISPTSWRERRRDDNRKSSVSSSSFSIDLSDKDSKEKEMLSSHKRFVIDDIEEETPTAVPLDGRDRRVWNRRISSSSSSHASPISDTDLLEGPPVDVCLDTKKVEMRKHEERKARFTSLFPEPSPSSLLSSRPPLDRLTTSSRSYGSPLIQIPWWSDRVSSVIPRRSCWSLCEELSTDEDRGGTRHDFDSPSASQTVDSTMAFCSSSSSSSFSSRPHLKWRSNWANEALLRRVYVSNRVGRRLLTRDRHHREKTEEDSSSPWISSRLNSVVHCGKFITYDRTGFPEAELSTFKPAWHPRYDSLFASAGPNGELHIFAVEDEGGRSSVPAITPITSPVLRLRLSGASGESPLNLVRFTPSSDMLISTSQDRLILWAPPS